MVVRNRRFGEVPFLCTLCLGQAGQGAHVFAEAKLWTFHVKALPRLILLADDSSISFCSQQRSETAVFQLFSPRRFELCDFTGLAPSIALSSLPLQPRKGLSPHWRPEVSVGSKSHKRHQRFQQTGDEPKAGLCKVLLVLRRLLAGLSEGTCSGGLMGNQEDTNHLGSLIWRHTHVKNWLLFGFLQEEAPVFVFIAPDRPRKSGSGLTLPQDSHRCYVSWWGGRGREETCRTAEPREKAPRVHVQHLSWSPQAGPIGFLCMSVDSTSEQWPNLGVGNWEKLVVNIGLFGFHSIRNGSSPVGRLDQLSWIPQVTTRVPYANIESVQATQGPQANQALFAMDYPQGSTLAEHGGKPQHLTVLLLVACFLTGPKRVASNKTQIHPHQVENTGLLVRDRVFRRCCFKGEPKANLSPF